MTHYCVLGLSVASVSAVRVPHAATWAWGTERMKLSSTGPSSTLPAFFFMARSEEGGALWGGYNFTGGRGDPLPFNARTSCPDDVFDNTSPDLRVPKLPWRLQQDWGCERKSTDVDVLVLENAALRAAITTQWGGKVWSLFHKGMKKQLFFNNPAHQPANIGYLKAWSSGGAEWNWAPGKIGHSVFTESPVWTAVLPTRLGPMVRVWEYDRLNGTVWQVDMLLVNETFYAHPKITNPHPIELPGYWWTCVAMPVDSPLTRVITPSSLSVNADGCAPWPNGGLDGDNSSFRGPDINGCAAAHHGRGTCAWQDDLSFLGNIPHANDFFMHIDKGQQPWIAHSRADGWTVVHSHPDKLNGTKFFQWGYNEFGMFNEDFLSATETDVHGCNPDAYDPYCANMTHPGRYTELQVGPARTQMHTFPLPAARNDAAVDDDTTGDGATVRTRHGSYEWTEWFKAFQADPEDMQHPDYSVPVDKVGAWIVGPDGVSRAELADIDALFTEMSDQPPTKAQIVSKGMPWGGLQQKLLTTLHRRGGKSETAAAAAAVLAPGCPFPAPETTDETQPWLELLETGTFSNETLGRTPVNFEVSDTWVGLLDKSMAAGHATWLHHLFLGTHALEVGNAEAGQAHMRASMALHPSVPAARALAMLTPTVDAAAKAYDLAWSVWSKLDPDLDSNAVQLGADLSGEIVAWLVVNERWDDLESFLPKLTVAYLAKDRALHAQAALAVHKGDFATALPILRGNCFPTYGNERKALIQLWHRAQEMKTVAAKGGIPLTIREKLALRRRLRCSGDSTTSTLDSACICGPPNLGYAY